MTHVFISELLIHRGQHVAKTKAWSKETLNWSQKMQSVVGAVFWRVSGHIKVQKKKKPTENDSVVFLQHAKNMCWAALCSSMDDSCDHTRHQSINMMWLIKDRLVSILKHTTDVYTMDQMLHRNEELDARGWVRWWGAYTAHSTHSTVLTGSDSSAANSAGNPGLNSALLSHIYHKLQILWVERHNSGVLPWGNIN